jgi:hypothetical protein
MSILKSRYPTHWLPTHSATESALLRMTIQLQAFESQAPVPKLYFMAFVVAICFSKAQGLWEEGLASLTCPLSLTPDLLLDCALSRQMNGWEINEWILLMGSFFSGCCYVLTINTHSMRAVNVAFMTKFSSLRLYFRMTFPVFQGL